MNVALLVLGLLAARLGLLLASLPGPWSIAVGVVVAGAAVWLWRADPAFCGLKLPAAAERRLAQSGMGGAVVLGALIGTVMSPCATPALAAALALAGSGALFGMTMSGAQRCCWPTGSAQRAVAGGRRDASAASALARRFARFEAWIRDGAPSRSSCSSPACGGSRRASTKTRFEAGASSGSVDCRQRRPANWESDDSCARSSALTWTRSCTC